MQSPHISQRSLKQREVVLRIFTEHCNGFPSTYIVSQSLYSDLQSYTRPSHHLCSSVASFLTFCPIAYLLPVILVSFVGRDDMEQVPISSPLHWPFPLSETHPVLLHRLTPTLLSVHLLQWDFVIETLTNHLHPRIPIQVTRNHITALLT